MYYALNRDSSLDSPTVGTFVAAVAPGAVLTEGLVVGHLTRAGKVLPILAPAGIQARVGKVVTARGWVEFGTPLFALGAPDAELGAVSTSADAASDDAGTVLIRAETDGTIYLSPDPASPPFVASGAVFEARATLALIEVMKTFTPVRSAAAGTLEKALVASGASVVAGQPLFRVRP